MAMAYNYLEEMMQAVFQSCMSMDSEYSERLFHKLNNRDRIDMLSAAIKSSRFHRDAKERLSYLLQCYDICTENRNILMHAAFRETFADMLHLGKRSSNNPKVENAFRISLAELRRIAEEICEQTSYATDLYYWVSVRKVFPPSYRNSLKTPPLSKLSAYPNLVRILQGVPDFGTTLPERPRKPHKLTPYLPPKAGTVVPFPPRPSRA